MQCKKILLVGLYDNNYTILLKLLYTQQSRFHMLTSAGMDWYAHTELPPDPSVEKIALDMGFVITSHDPVHPNIEREARAIRREVFHHRPQHITRLREFSTFNAIVTPHRTVHDRLRGWQHIPREKLHWINGIKPDDSVAHVFPIFQEWVNQHRF